VADPRIHATIVVAKERPIPTISLQSGWLQNGRTHILTSIVVATEWPTPHSHVYRSGRGPAESLQQLKQRLAKLAPVRQASEED